jgi:hypothetical protein
LTFENISLFTAKPIGSVFYPEIQEFYLKERLCTNQLLHNVNQVLAKSEQLFQENLNDLIDHWLNDTNIWKQIGISSILYDCVINFINKKSILIDDSVFLISTSDSDTEAVLQNLSNGQNQDQQSNFAKCEEGKHFN